MSPAWSRLGPPVAVAHSTLPWGSIRAANTSSSPTLVRVTLPACIDPSNGPLTWALPAAARAMRGSPPRTPGFEMSEVLYSS